MSEEDQQLVSVQRLDDDGESYTQVGTGVVVSTDVVLLKLPVFEELSRPGEVEPGRFRVVAAPLEPRPELAFWAPVGAVHVSPTAEIDGSPLVIVTVNGYGTCPVGGSVALHEGESVALHEPEPVVTIESIAAELDRLQEPGDVWLKTTGLILDSGEQPPQDSGEQTPHGQLQPPVPPNPLDEFWRGFCKRFPSLCNREPS